MDLSALLRSVGLYEASLETAELPTALLLAMDELEQSPETNKAQQLQEVAHILLQMISFPDRQVQSSDETLATLQSARDWAVETLLDASTPRTELLHPLELSPSLLQLQSTLFAAAPCRQSDAQMELHQSLLVELQSAGDESLVDLLDTCATSIEDDTLFLQFAEAALSREMLSLVFSSAFLHRLFDRRGVQQMDELQRQHRTRRLFDVLSLSSKICVWANHLPSWRSQLQTWMVEAHRKPFQPIDLVLPDGWWGGGHSNAAQLSSTPAVAPALRQYSHLYVTLIEWCRTHIEFLASSRSMELVSVLSRSILNDNAARVLFNRELTRQLPSHTEFVTSAQKPQVFLTLHTRLQKLPDGNGSTDVMWQHEWIGVQERPFLLHEALDAIFPLPDDGATNDRSEEDTRATARQSAAQFFGWFYSYSNLESADQIAAILLQMTAELTILDLNRGDRWLRRSRADFGVLPIVRLRLVWFWLLKSIEQSVQAPASINPSDLASATTSVLESMEYIFRRFTPPRTKRPFQVEFVSQLLLEFEWRAHVTKAKEDFLERTSLLCRWLTKIVQLMQLEEHQAQQKDSQRRHRSGVVNDVKSLSKRLEGFCR